MAKECKRESAQVRCQMTSCSEAASAIKKLREQIKKDESLLKRFVLVDGGTSVKDCKFK